MFISSKSKVCKLRGLVPHQKNTMFMHFTVEQLFCFFMYKNKIHIGFIFWNITAAATTLVQRRVTDGDLLEWMYISFGGVFNIILFLLYCEIFTTNWLSHLTFVYAFTTFILEYDCQISTFNIFKDIYELKISVHETNSANERYIRGVLGTQENTSSFQFLRAARTNSKLQCCRFV